MAVDYEKGMRPNLYELMQGGGGGGYVLPPATAETLGGVIVGDGLNVEADGTLSAEGGTPYELPPATAETLGGVKIGEGVEVEADGTISVEGSTPVEFPIEISQGGTGATSLQGAKENLGIPDDFSNCDLTVAPLATSATFLNNTQGEQVLLGNGSDEVSVLIRANTTQGPQMTQNLMPTKAYMNAQLATKQNTLVSGTNIKTVNNESLLGSGDIEIAQYTLPPATDETLGGIIVGDGLNVESDGTLSSENGTFVVTYGVTKFQEVFDALNAGKTLLYKASAQSTPVLRMVARSSTGFVFLQVLQAGTIFSSSLSNSNVWTENPSVPLQEKLTSGTNIKTINNQSLLGSGNIEITQYTLPPATAQTLGGVKVGNGLAVANDGTLSTSGTADVSFIDWEGASASDLYAMLQEKPIMVYLRDGTCGFIYEWYYNSNTLTIYITSGARICSVNIFNTEWVEDQDYTLQKELVTSELAAQAVGAWIDSNGTKHDVYRKVVDLGALPNAASMTVAHGIPSGSRIIDYWAMAANSDGSSYMKIPFVALSVEKGIYMQVGRSNITIQTGSDRTNLTAFAVIDYYTPSA